MNKINDRLYSWASYLEPEALDQAITTSKMPFIYKHVALMADAHFGMGSTVGSVVPTIGAIIPSCVGVDEGCGMGAVKTQFKLNELKDKDLSVLRHSIERSIPLSAGAYNRTYTTSARHRIDELEAMANKNSKLKFYDSLVRAGGWRSQLGSLGSGNHFCEIVTDEEENIWAFLHSGSRGIGNKLGTYHIRKALDICKKSFIKLEDPNLAYLIEDTTEYNGYLEDLNWAQRYAFLNREEMLDRVIKDLGYFMGQPVIEQERILCHHNYTAVENHMGQDVHVTRKGAIAAFKGTMGLIPGSMGTRSYVVEGNGNIPSFCSAPHGAGRKMSRNKAKETFSLDDLRTAMQGIEYKDDSAFIDEIPGAYKDVEQVMEDSKDLVTITHTLRQILNVKGL